MRSNAAKPSSATIHSMRSGVVHEPPPEAVIDALVRAGLSRHTALAMEPAKATEVLDLLRSEQLRCDLREHAARS